MAETNSTNGKQPKKQAKTNSNINTFNNLRRITRQYLKEKYPDCRDGLEALNRLQELSQQHDEREIAACFFRFSATGGQLAEFMKEYSK